MPFYVKAVYISWTLFHKCLELFIVRLVVLHWSYLLYFLLLLLRNNIWHSFIVLASVFLSHYIQNIIGFIKKARQKNWEVNKREENKVILCRFGHNYIVASAVGWLFASQENGGICKKKKIIFIKELILNICMQQLWEFLLEY